MVSTQNDTKDFNSRPLTVELLLCSQLIARRKSCYTIQMETYHISDDDLGLDFFLRRARSDITTGPRLGALGDCKIARYVAATAP
jgi:hypothetical protein